MFTIIYEKDTGDVKNICSGEANEEELRKAIPETCDFIIAEQLLETKPYREKLIVKDGALFVKELELTAEEEKQATYFENLAELNDLRRKLTETDYKAIKFAEGLISTEDYEPIKQERQGYRDRINELEEKLSKL